MTFPSGSITRVRTLPMSCSSADQRTIGLGTDCSTTSFVCSQTSLWRRPPSCEKSTVASSSGSTVASTPASCIHCSPTPSALPMITFSSVCRSCAAGSVATQRSRRARRLGDRGSGGAIPPAIAIARSSTPAGSANGAAAFPLDSRDIERDPAAARYDVIFRLS